MAAARRAIDQERSRVLGQTEPGETLLSCAQRHLASLTSPSLRHVINATGVIVHTNLGRAPLAQAARDALARVANGYSNLELDLESGGRGSRQAHVENLLRELTGADAAIVVNNGAAAVLLAVAALAGPGEAVIVSRGQLVEIGGGFRIPDVIAQSGATMVEVGTTNRTNRGDYERALAASRGVILRVHQSNFRTVGFVEEVTIEELCQLGVPVIDDLGSGVLSAGSRILALGGEPDLKRSLGAGAALVCCSGDKLLGGPQAGLMVGGADAVARCRSHPLARALRIDKLSLAALEATLLLHRSPAQARAEIPVLSMLGVATDVLERRAERLRDAIGADSAEIVRTTARAGGGALPATELEGPAVAIVSGVAPTELAVRLRAFDPPVVTRISDGRVVVDPRTLSDDELDIVARAVSHALAPR